MPQVQLSLSREGKRIKGRLKRERAEHEQQVPLFLSPRFCCHFDSSPPDSLYVQLLLQREELMYLERGASHLRQAAKVTDQGASQPAVRSLLEPLHTNKQQQLERGISRLKDEIAMMKQSQEVSFPASHFWGGSVRRIAKYNNLPCFIGSKSLCRRQQKDLSIIHANSKWTCSGLSGKWVTKLQLWSSISLMWTMKY